LWRQGDRHQSHATDQESRALYRRTLGREIPQDLHLSEGADRRGVVDDRRILLAALRAGGLPRPRRAGQYPRAPLWRAQYRLCHSGGVMLVSSLFFGPNGSALSEPADVISFLGKGKA